MGGPALNLAEGPATDGPEEDFFGALAGAAATGVGFGAGAGALATGAAFGAGAAFGSGLAAFAGLGAGFVA